MMALRRDRPPRRRKAPFDFVDPAVALETIREMTRSARRERVELVLIGGLAMSFYGSDRLTRDVDFAASKLPLFATLGHALPMGGRRVWTAHGLELNFVEPEDPRTLALFRDAVKKARRTRWGFKVVTPEHLAAMKIAAARGKDMLDLDYLLRVRRRGRALVDRRKTRSVVRKFLGKTFAAAFESACNAADASQD